MLKITKVVLARQEVTLQLDGRVTGQWVELLRETADLALSEGSHLNVDLENVCFIDCEGIELIKRLLDHGVQPVNTPLFIIEQIRRCTDVKDS